jgi:hypothetical protein
VVGLLLQVNAAAVLEACRLIEKPKASELIQKRSFAGEAAARQKHKQLNVEQKQQNADVRDDPVQCLKIYFIHFMVLVISVFILFCPGAVWTITLWLQGIRSPLRGSSVRAAAAASDHQQLPMAKWQTMCFIMNESAEAAALSAPRNAVLSSTTASATTAAASSATTVESLLGMTRLWRGVESILLGCTPAHALYFSVYETLKAAAPRNHKTGEVVWWASFLTGAAATVGHDLTMPILLELALLLRIAD